MALYDGQRTLLFRHPRPPPEFISLEGRSEARVFPGRHETVRANTAMEIGGILTATYAIDERKGRSARQLATGVLHEAFHVYQRERHPDWAGNEVELFVYPVENADLLGLRRLESEALGRALAEGDSAQAACWAAAALAKRRERFKVLNEGSAAYERGTELNEGLAQYVEVRALGERLGERGRSHELSGPVLPKDEFAADEVRRRSYASGQALALLLDRFEPGWPERLEKGEGASLDELLEAALSRRAAGPCPFSDAEEARALEQARTDTRELVARNEASRRDFLDQPGWTLIVLADRGEPLFPQGFDPLNVQNLGAGEVLHTRWVKLGNSAGAMEVLDRQALTEGAGEHPLFEGVRRVVVAGLSGEPAVRQSASAVTLEATGVKGEFRGGRLERAGRTLTVRL